MRTLRNHVALSLLDTACHEKNEMCHWETLVIIETPFLYFPSDVSSGDPPSPPLGLHASTVDGLIRCVLLLASREISIFPTMALTIFCFIHLQASPPGHRKRFQEDGGNAKTLRGHHLLSVYLTPFSDWGIRVLNRKSFSYF